MVGYFAACYLVSVSARNMEGKNAMSFLIFPCPEVRRRFPAMRLEELCE